MITPPTLKSARATAHPGPQSSPSISVALATFNGERFLQEQLDSLARQTRLPNELVVVDDGSSDDTLSILETFAGDAPFPVRIHRNGRRLGWRGNFMRAAGLCRGDLIAFCDQDDIWYRDKLDIVASFLSDPSILLVHHEADLIDQHGDTIGRLRKREADRPRLERLEKPTIWSHAPGLTMMFRRSLLDFSSYWSCSVDPGAPDKPAAHDQWIYHLASNLGVIAFVSRPLVGYRQHASNQIGYRAQRHWALRSRTCLRDEIAVHRTMIASFTIALQHALAEKKTKFDTSLLSAISANRELGKKLTLRLTIYAEPSIRARLKALRSLIISGAYKRSTTWSLGYRSLVVDCRAVLFRTN